MNIKKFLNIDIEPTPPELQLSVEVRCREIMASNDIDKDKKICNTFSKASGKARCFSSFFIRFFNR